MRTIIAVSQNSATSIYNVESARNVVNYELIARLMRDQGVDKSVDDVKRIYRHLEQRSNTGFVSFRVHKFTEYWKELFFFKQHLNQNGLSEQPRNENDTFLHIPALEDGQETSANVRNLLIRSGYTRQGPASQTFVDWFLPRYLPGFLHKDVWPRITGEPLSYCRYYMFPTLNSMLRIATLPPHSRPYL